MLEPHALTRWDATMITQQKRSGAYYTPESVAATLVRWAVRRSTDRLLDPSCGDGRFLAAHANAVGVDRDPVACVLAKQVAPGAEVHGAFVRISATVQGPRSESRGIMSMLQERTNDK